MTIDRWDVYHVPACRHSNPPKDKFVVVAFFDPNPYGFFINSAIRPFLINNNHTICEAPIFHRHHRFLRHDSWVDCTTAYSFFASELTDCVGSLTPANIADVRTAAQACRILKKRHQLLVAA